MKKAIGRISFMGSVKALAQRLLRPVAITLGILGAVCYLLSGITVTSPDGNETASCDDGCWEMIESERNQTL